MWWRSRGGGSQGVVGSRGRGSRSGGTLKGAGGLKGDGV